MSFFTFTHKDICNKCFSGFFSSKEVWLAMLYNIRTSIKVTLFTFCYMYITNCSYIVSPITEKLAENLSIAILEQDDPETVKYGAPAYLIMIDGLIAGDPTNKNLLMAGAKLYGAYANAFVDDPLRAKNMANKAWGFATQLLCLEFKSRCEIHKRPFDEYKAFLSTISKENIDLIYTYGISWASYIQANTGDWNAIADLPKVTATMRKVQKLDDTYDNGGVHLYLGVLASLLPPSLGGKPEEAKFHFQHAIELSKGENLLIKVIYAEKYARMIFDRKLHDDILQSVIKSQPRKPGLTLMNILAQDRAKDLLKSADEYF